MNNINFDPKYPKTGNSVRWIKLTPENLPMRGVKVIVTDGYEWKSAYVSRQYEFKESRKSKLVYKDVTYFAYIELPQIELPIRKK